MARRKRREGQALHRVLGVPALFSTAYGNVGSSIYYALGVVALSALGVTPLVFIVTGLLFMTTAWSYAEATSALPEAGGSSSFARRGFNEMVSFGAGWALMLDYIITIAISAFFVPNYLSAFWPALKYWPYNTIGGIVAILALVVVNVIGIKEAARLNIILAVLDLATQLLIMVVGLVLVLAPRMLIEQINLGVAPTWHQLIYGISIGTVAYTGIETISNMAEEAEDPGRTVPKAINLVLAVVLTVYAGTSVVALSAMPVGYNTLPVDPTTGRTVPVAVVQDPSQQRGEYVLKSDPKQEVFLPVEKPGEPETVIPAQNPTGDVTRVGDQYLTEVYGTKLGSVYREDPVLGVVAHFPGDISWLKAVLRPWVGILAATILVIATNAGLIGISRLAYSLAQHRQLPPAIGRVHMTRLTPYVAIILFGIVASIIILPGSTALLADLYAFGAMLSFTAAHASVIALRIREPNLPRPFRAPLNVRIRGYEIPLTAVIGGLGTLTVWFVVVLTHPEGRIVGLTWMGLGFVMYIIYRLRNEYPLTRTVKRVRLPALAGEDIVYDRILVPLQETRIADEMMVLAAQLATEKRSEIDALYVVEIPMNLPLDADLPDERAKAERLLEKGAGIADQFGVKVHPHVLPARQAGKAIVETAEERHSEVIILGSRRRQRAGGRKFGKTVEYVLDHAPTEVIHTIVPKEYPESSEEAAPAGDGTSAALEASLQPEVPPEPAFAPEAPLPADPPASTEPPDGPPDEPPGGPPSEPPGGPPDEASTRA